MTGLEELWEIVREGVKLNFILDKKEVSPVMEMAATASAFPLDSNISPQLVLFDGFGCGKGRIHPWERPCCLFSIRGGVRCVREGRGAPQVPISHHCQHWVGFSLFNTLCSVTEGDEPSPQGPAGGSTGIPSIHSSLQVQLELFCPWNSGWKRPGRFQSLTVPWLCHSDPVLPN